MAIIPQPQPVTPNAVLTFNGGSQTAGFTSSAGFGSATIAAGNDGVSWWLANTPGSPWLISYGRFDITGGLGADRLGPGILGAFDDTIRGGAGNDTITGSAAGADVIDGGPGRDTLIWSWSGFQAPISISLAPPGGTQVAGGTTISSFEVMSLTMGQGADLIDTRGTAALGWPRLTNEPPPWGLPPIEFASYPVPIVFGGGGDDSFLVDHTTGDVVLHGGDGIDTVHGDFSAQAAPVVSGRTPRPDTVPLLQSLIWWRTLDFGSGVIALGHFNDMLLKQPKTSPLYPERWNLTLGSGHDSVLGSMITFPEATSPSVTLLGGAGDDSLGGTAGDDVLDGGESIDTLIFTAVGSSMIRLDIAGAQATGAGHDVIRDIENLRLLDHPVFFSNITVMGSAVANRIEIDPAQDYGMIRLRADGLGGNDTLLGGEGRDTLMGGAGDDSIAGGDNHDTLAGGIGSNIVSGGAGSDTLTIDGARRGGTLTIAADAAIADGLAGPSAAVQGSYAGSRETTAFTGIETLSFTDGRLIFDPGDVAFQVSRLYQVAFNRAPDPYGLNFWIDALQAGTTLATVASRFALSTEFRALYDGIDNTGFVTALYQNMLGRAPDAPGLAFWTGNLTNGAGRDSVLLGFAESPEFRGLHLAANITGIWDQDDATASIARLYQATLNRRPEEAGLRDWRAEMAAGKSLADLVPGFTGSIEFTTLYGATSNQAFVTLLYNNVLGRAPDAAGFAGWVAQLDAGGTRTDVVLGFSESLEFRLSTMSWIEGGIVFA